jgi:hypothetical protein
MAHSGIASAVTRPEEHTGIIATSFELDQDMKDWEATAATTWVVSGDRKVDALTIDRATRKRFPINHKDVMVCL